MQPLLQQFQGRVEPVRHAEYDQVTPRLAGLLRWMESEPTITEVLDKLRAAVKLDAVLCAAGSQQPPRAETPDEIAAVGLRLMECCGAGQHLYIAAIELGIAHLTSNSNFQDYVDTAMRGFVEPLFAYVTERISDSDATPSPETVLARRIHAAVLGSLALRQPATAQQLSSIARRFGELEDAGDWQNVGNSCREALKVFAGELRSSVPDVVAQSVKNGDVKTIIGELLKGSSHDRYGETLRALVTSAWDHCASVTHRKSTTREQALRAFVWTVLAVCAVSDVVPTQRAEASP